MVSTGRQKQKEMDPIAEQYFRENEFIATRLGEKILQQVHIKTLKGNNRMYIYQDGYYHLNGRAAIKTLCSQLLGEEYTRYRQEETKIGRAHV